MVVRQVSYCSAASMLLLWISLASTASAGIINGDFQTGDLTGWTVSAIDDAGDPVTPLISVGTAAGNSFAVLDTGSFASGPFISTVEQSFLVDSATPFLSFDFSGFFTSADPTGTGSSLFPDAFFVSLQSGASFFDLLMLDDAGALADPFGTAPGTVTLGAPLASGFDFTFTADLSSLAGQNVTLFADLFSEDDALRSFVWFDNAQLRSRFLEKSEIPEPAAGTVWGLLIVVGAGRQWWRHRRSKRVRPV